jgi:ornithine decarboxylase
MNVTPYGVSFHVGSQQRDIGQWDNSIAKGYYIFQMAKKKGLELQGLNIGGGLPANYLHPAPEIRIYAQEIRRFLDEYFGGTMPEIFIEPGRFLVGDAGIIVSEVIMVEQKTKVDPYKWVYLDIGVFGGLIETLGEAIKYPIYVEKNGHPEAVILAGPTCDSVDILYEHYKYKLPDTIGPGDRVYIFSTGAYTQTYSSVGFNGIPPLKAYVLN